MKVREVLQALPLRAVHLADPEREICGAYAGDLLSWVMGRAKPDQAWVTIMTNANVIAVASLLDLSVVIICDKCEPEPALIAAAEARGINLLAADMPLFEMCAALGRLLT